MPRPRFLRPPMVRAARLEAGVPRVVPARVGLLPWHAPRAAWTFIVKVAKDAAPGSDPEAFLEPRPLHAAPPEEPTRAPYADGAPPPSADDFAPAKNRVDVLLVGHAVVGDRGAAGRYGRRAALQVGRRTFDLALEGPSPGKVPLWGSSLVSDGRPTPDETPPRVGPTWVAPSDLDDDVLRREEWDRHQCAPPHLQLDVPPGTRIAAVGLGETGEPIMVEVPRAAPLVWIQPLRDDAFESEILLRLDTVTLDVDARRADLVYRGYAFAPDRPRDVDRVVVAWMPLDGLAETRAERWEETLRELPHGVFGQPTLREEARRGEEAPPLAEEDLEELRWGTLDENASPTATTDPRRYATIARDLGEGGDRAVILAKHGLDEYRWAVEERAWASLLAEPPRAATLQVDDPEDARTALAREELLLAKEAGPPRLSAEQTARAAVRMERGDPRSVLRDLGMGIGAFARLDADWRARAAKDPAVAAAMRTAAADEATRLGPEDDGALPKWEGVPQ